ncbi:hypothetical protein yc1106_07537 [Curvularia clavata]|uniref:L-dopachrome isomerase n=1 Tax=Curvularia clavata TaxID=95742 RepID=A0A9Q8ZGG3_CURCL|nr:hypothetical protein yc1106_07537 [Curvularia clavata]
MSRPSSASTQSGAAFPKQAGTALLVPDNTAGPQSPAASQFSFTSSPYSVLDVAERPRQFSQETPAPGPGPLRPMTSRARAKFYDDQFAEKTIISSSARERISKDAPIVAELRTNVIIKDEYTLVTDLSHHLSTRYQRPEASIMISVQHSACLLLGGSFEPTYFLTISALPAQVQPTTNKRNAALIQTFMAESIGVPSDRGIIKFVPIAEESLAINGMTILGEIERLERQQAEENGVSNVTKRVSTKNSRKFSMGKSKSNMQLSRGSSKADQAPKPAPIAEIPPAGPLDSAVAVNETGIAEVGIAERPVSKMSNKKSEPKLSLFSKSANASSTHLTPPPIPADAPAVPSINKRQSFMKVFRR